MEKLVRSFNSLPRPERTATGLPNHWAFAVRHVSLKPQGDVVVVVQPWSHTLLGPVAGPAQILTLADNAAMAHAIVPHLLQAFVKRAHMEPTTGMMVPDMGIEVIAPWSWATEDTGLANAIGSALKQHGVRGELCRVYTINPEQRGALKEGWSRLMGAMMKTIGMDAGRKQEIVAALDPVSGRNAISVCYNCYETASRSAALRWCEACGRVRYCSTECQSRDWKRHKPACQQPSSGELPGLLLSSGVSEMDAQAYYNTTAHTVPEARALASTLNFTLPKGDGAMVDTM